jgi:hypothetical protein
MSPVQSKARLSSRQVTKGIEAAVVTNTAVIVIQVTEDRVRLILREYEHQYQRQNMWQLPLGIFVSLLVTCLTTRAIDIGPISSEHLTGALWLLTGFSFLWYLNQHVRHCRKSSDKGTIDDVVSRLKYPDNESPKAK